MGCIRKCGLCSIDASNYLHCIYEVLEGSRSLQYYVSSRCCCSPHYLFFLDWDFFVQHWWSGGQLSQRRHRMFQHSG